MAIWQKLERGNKFHLTHFQLVALIDTGCLEHGVENSEAKSKLSRKESQRQRNRWGVIEFMPWIYHLRHR